MAESAADRFQALYEQHLNPKGSVEAQILTIPDPATFLDSKKVERGVQGGADAVYGILKRGRFFEGKELGKEAVDALLQSNEFERTVLLNMNPQRWHDLFYSNLLVQNNGGGTGLLPERVFLDLMGEFFRYYSGDEIHQISVERTNNETVFDLSKRNLRLAGNSYNAIRVARLGPLNVYNYSGGTLPSVVAETLKKVEVFYSSLAQGTVGPYHMFERDENFSKGVLGVLFPDNQVSTVRAMITSGFAFHELNAEQQWLLLANPSKKYSLQLQEAGSLECAIPWEKMVHVDRALTHYLLQRVLEGQSVELTEFHSEGVRSEVAQEQERMGQWFSRKFKKAGVERFTDHAAPDVAERVHRTFVGVDALAREASDLEECAAGRTELLNRAKELRAYAGAWRVILEEVVADYELKLRLAQSGSRHDIGWLTHQDALVQIVERPVGPNAQKLLTATRTELDALVVADAEVREIATDY